MSHVISNNVMDESKESKWETPKYSGLKNSNLMSLLKNTYNALKLGCLDCINKNLKNQFESCTLEEFTKSYENETIIFETAFSEQPPDEDEYVINLKNAVKRCSYLLTNKYFYFFGLDKGVLSKKYPSGRVALTNIKECNYKKKGLVMYKAAITLKSGETIHIKDLMKSIPLDLIKIILTKDLLNEIRFPPSDGKSN